jgi:hypothetical protein
MENSSGTDQFVVSSAGAITTGSYTATAIATAYIADDAITLAKMASGTDGNIISYDASGNPVAIATGSDGQVLTSTGAGSPPAFEDAGGGGASSLDGLTDVTIVGTRNLFIETDGAAPPHSVTGSGQDNLAIGHDALVNISGGHYNVGIGTNALNAQTASRSVAIGTNAMQYASANYCVAIGHEALMGDSASNSYSQYNTAVGYLTLKASTTGDKNVALGMNAGVSVTSGSSNIFIGNSAGHAHTTDSDTLYIANEAAAYAGTIIKGDMSNKFLAIGSADVTLSTADATLQIFPKGTDDTALYVKQVGSSTGNLILMENSSGTDQFVVSSAGACTSVTSFTAPLIEGSTSVQTPLIEYTDGDDAITIADGGACTFPQKITASKAIQGAIVTATEDATVVIDLSTSNYFEITLGANVTDIDFTNGSVGQRFVIRFEQPSGANYTIVYSAVTHDLDGGGSPATVTVSWPGGTAPTMTATNDKADTYGFIVRAEGHFDGYVIGQNIAETTN